tara:strand:- start:179 stop:1006 length:828 start_codon:yes stop_codon:yes gene_type:complete
MKPMKVDVGEYAPDVDELIEKANNMDEMLTKIASLRDDSQLRNITGVEEAQMTHYWTNQYQPEEDIETVQRDNPSVESVNLIDANPHQTGSSLAAHENTAGGIMKEAKPDFFDADGDGNKTESMKDALKNKKGKKIGIKKGNMGQKDKYCMKNFGKKYFECSAKEKAQCDRVHGGVKKAPPMPGGPKPPMGGGGGGGDDAAMLAALMGGGDAPPPDMGGGMGGEVPSDPAGISDMLMELGKKVKALGGGGGDMPAPDMPMGGDAGAGGPPDLPGM